MTSNPSSTIRALDLDDLDLVVGGATVAAVATQTHHDTPPDGGFLTSLQHAGSVVAHDAAPVAATGQAAVNASVADAAAAMAAGHETVATAISAVEKAAQTAHVSTDAALTGLLNATHGNTLVATELTTRLVNGTAESEMVMLAGTGHLASADVTTIVDAATGALAKFSADGQSALGLTQPAAAAIIEAKISDTAHALVSDQTAMKGLQIQETMIEATLNDLHGGAAEGAISASMNAQLGVVEQQIKTLTAGNALLGHDIDVAAVSTFTKAFDTTEAANIQLAKGIETSIGGQINATLAAAEHAPLVAATLTSDAIHQAASVGHAMELAAEQQAQMLAQAQQTIDNAGKSGLNTVENGLSTAASDVGNFLKSL